MSLSAEEKKTLDGFVQESPQCDKCDESPYFFLSVKGTVISGCETHMIQISTKISKAGYMSKHISHETVEIVEDKVN